MGLLPLVGALYARCRRRSGVLYWYGILYMLRTRTWEVDVVRRALGPRIQPSCSKPAEAPAVAWDTSLVSGG